MRQKFAICFGILIIIFVPIWIVGILAGAVIPLFGGIRAETLGRIGFLVASTAEICVYLFSWLFHRLELNSEKKFKGFSGGKKYGNKK
jgi:hypothetical protein